MFKGFFSILIVISLASCSKEPRVVDGDPEPPMPGFFERNFTWHGVDADKDGVIDDVEIWINNNIEDPNLKKAYKQYTTDIIIALDNVEDKGISKRKTLEMLDTLKCVHYFERVIYEDSRDRINIQDRYKGQMFGFLNTGRNKRHQKLSMNFAGTAGVNTKRSADYWQFCRFKVENLNYYENLTREKFPGAFDKLLE